MCRESQRKLTIQWANRNSIQIYIAVGKRGKTVRTSRDCFWFYLWLDESCSKARENCANESPLVSVLLLIGWKLFQSAGKLCERVTIGFGFTSDWMKAVPKRGKTVRTSNHWFRFYFWLDESCCEARENCANESRFVSVFLLIGWKLLRSAGKLCERVTIGFSFTSDWMNAVAKRGKTVRTSGFSIISDWMWGGASL